METEQFTGAPKPKLQELPQIKERISFLYVERCQVSRSDSALTITDERGTVHVPIAMIGVLMLGPGATISHRAMELLGDTGSSAIWVGEHGVRYYAHGRPLTHSAKLLEAQAALVSNSRSRLAVARKMYQMRFANEDVSGMTMQQLRGREGARIRRIYRHSSHQTGVPWHGREYDSNSFTDSDPINMALSAAHACLYGAVHSVIVALGCSPGLGFIHTGHERSFVYDIADLYKAELTIPIAFEVVQRDPADVAAETRRAVRDAIANGRLMEKTVKDISNLLTVDEVESEIMADTLHLWDEKSGLVAAYVSYGKDTEELGEVDIGYGEILSE
jgi:CRISPR-associated protein Cas1